MCHCPSLSCTFCNKKGTYQDQGSNPWCPYCVFTYKLHMSSCLSYSDKQGAAECHGCQCASYKNKATYQIFAGNSTITTTTANI